MSKSLARVTRALTDHGIDHTIVETNGARTAQMAAEAVGCHVDQIAKSIIFQGVASGRVYLFVTAGGNMVDAAKASAVAGEELGKSDAAVVREQTGFAIGGVSPVGHLTPSPTFFDPRLNDFDVVWAAAGTPNHVFSINPADLEKISGGQVADFVQL